MSRAPRDDIAAAWLSVRHASIPARLQAADQWVLWRAEPDGGGKPRKVPYRIADPSLRASSTDPSTWGSFRDAVEAYGALIDVPSDPRRGAVAGIGIVLTQAGGLACIDLDHVIDAHGQLDPQAAQIVRAADSWTERSPSGTGLHIFLLGTIPAAVKGDQIEIYSDVRYIAVTGHQWPGTPDDLRAGQPYLDRLVSIARRMEAPDAPRRPWTGKTVPPPDDLAGALLARLEDWGLPAIRTKRWSDGYLVELEWCPWASEHTSGPGGAAVMIHASGAFDFTCLHAHCAGRGWRDFRAAVEGGR